MPKAFMILMMENSRRYIFDYNSWRYIDDNLIIKHDAKQIQQLSRVVKDAQDSLLKIFSPKINEVSFDDLSDIL